MQHTAAAERFDEIGAAARQQSRAASMRVSRALGKEGERADETYAANQKQADELAARLTAEEEKLVGLNAEKEELLAATADARNALRAAESRTSWSCRRSIRQRNIGSRRCSSSKKSVPSIRRRSKSFLPRSKNIGVRLAGVLADRLNVAEKPRPPSKRSSAISSRPSSSNRSTMQNGFALA